MRERLRVLRLPPLWLNGREGFETSPDSLRSGQEAQL